MIYQDKNRPLEVCAGVYAAACHSWPSSYRQVDNATTIGMCLRRAYDKDKTGQELKVLIQKSVSLAKAFGNLENQEQVRMYLHDSLGVDWNVIMLASDPYWPWFVHQEDKLKLAEDIMAGKAKVPPQPVLRSISRGTAIALLLFLPQLVMSFFFMGCGKALSLKVFTWSRGYTYPMLFAVLPGALPTFLLAGIIDFFRADFSKKPETVVSTPRSTQAVASKHNSSQDTLARIEQRIKATTSGRQL